MNILKKLAGKFLYGLAKLISVILDALIKVVEGVITVLGNVARGFIALIGAGGCLLFFILFGPLGLAILMNPLTLLLILFFVIIPILGTKLVSYLRYLRYITTEYLFDRSAYFVDGVSYEFDSLDGYKNKYRRMEAERKRREQERRRAEQQREWEERFRQWNEYQNYQRKNRNSSNYDWYGQNTSYGNQQTYVDPTSEFKRKYEESCDLLGVAYNVDKYEIKLAYRKKAKEYHPDLNKSPNATEMFQKIGGAYEFLSDGNIERYKNMN